MTVSEEHNEVLYPVFLKLQGKKCLVVGGGAIALQKVEALTESSAMVTVVSPELVPELLDYSRREVIMVKQRPYTSGDLDGYYLVIAATDQPDVNQLVCDEARARDILVNVVDVPPLCDFYVPSILRRGRLQVAVSTAGASPRLARRIRMNLEKTLPEAYGDLLECLNDLRTELKERLPEEPKERMRLNKMIADSPEISDFLEGNSAPLKELINNALSPYRD